MANTMFTYKKVLRITRLRACAIPDDGRGAEPASTRDLHYVAKRTTNNVHHRANGPSTSHLPVQLSWPRPEPSPALTLPSVPPKCPVSPAATATGRNPPFHVSGNLSSACLGSFLAPASLFPRSTDWMATAQ